MKKKILAVVTACVLLFGTIAMVGCGEEKESFTGENNFFYFKDIDPALDFYTPVIIANNKFMAENPETVKSFLKATKKGYEFAISNPKDAADILIKCNPELEANKELIYASQEYLKEQYKADVAQWGFIDQARWDAFNEFVCKIESDEVPDSITKGFGFTNEFLPSDGDNMPVKSETIQKVTFLLDWAPNTNHTGLYVALDKGFYEQCGLEVEIIQPGSMGTSGTVATGAAQFGVDFQDQMIHHESQKIETTAIAAIIQHNTSGILSKASANIQSPKDMEGKSYATWGAVVEQAVVKHSITVDGGDASTLDMQEKFVENIIAEFQNPNGVDSVWSFYGWDKVNLDLYKQNHTVKEA